MKPPFDGLTTLHTPFNKRTQTTIQLENNRLLKALTAAKPTIRHEQWIKHQQHASKYYHNARSMPDTLYSPRLPVTPRNRFIRGVHNDIHLNPHKPKKAPPSYSLHPMYYRPESPLTQPQAESTFSQINKDVGRKVQSASVSVRTKALSEPQRPKTRALVIGSVNNQSSLQNSVTGNNYTIPKLPITPAAKKQPVPPSVSKKLPSMPVRPSPIIPSSSEDVENTSVVAEMLVNDEVNLIDDNVDPIIEKDSDAVTLDRVDNKSERPDSASTNRTKDVLHVGTEFGMSDAAGSVVRHVILKSIPEEGDAMGNKNNVSSVNSQSVNDSNTVRSLLPQNSRLANEGNSSYDSHALESVTTEKKNDNIMQPIVEEEDTGGDNFNGDGDYHQDSDFEQNSLDQNEVVDDEAINSSEIQEDTHQNQDKNENSHISEGSPTKSKVTEGEIIDDANDFEDDFEDQSDDDLPIEMRDQEDNVEGGLSSHGENDIDNDNIPQEMEAMDEVKSNQVESEKRQLDVLQNNSNEENDLTPDEYDEDFE